MRAIGFRARGGPEVLADLTLPLPAPGPRDLLVEVHAVSVNPVDTKVRANGADPMDITVLGWDASGIVRAVGDAVTLFRPGDEVYYAGSIDRPGTNAQFHVVDERIVGPKPASLTHAEAASLPLTVITAWELLFDRLAVNPGDGEGRTLLIVGASGGVGSILTQLAARLTKLRVIGTASRPASQAWVRKLGAHRVIDHHQLRKELSAVGPIDYIASLAETHRNFADLVDCLAPQGKIALIDDPPSLDVVPLKRKAGSLHWEFMFTRPLFNTPDIGRQHELLAQVSRLIDAGVLRTTLTQTLTPIDASTMAEAHGMLEAGGMYGKIVVSGWAVGPHQDRTTAPEPKN